jgi:hypothetical protein
VVAVAVAVDAAKVDDDTTRVRDEAVPGLDWVSDVTERDGPPAVRGRELVGVPVVRTGDGDDRLRSDIELL